MTDRIRINYNKCIEASLVSMIFGSIVTDLVQLAHVLSHDQKTGNDILFCTGIVLGYGVIMGFTNYAMQKAGLYNGVPGYHTTPTRTFSQL